MTFITPDSTFLTNLLIPFVLIGLGMGLAVTPIAVAGTAGVPREQAGLASGLLNTSRTVGASLGLAVLATLAATKTTSSLKGVIATPAHTASALTDGYTLAFAVAAGLLVVTAAAGLATVPSLRSIRRLAQAPRHPRWRRRLWSSSKGCSRRPDGPRRRRTPRIFTNDSLVDRAGVQLGGSSICSMNSSRMPPGASTKAMRRVPKEPLTMRGPHRTLWRASSASRSSTKRAG